MIDEAGLQLQGEQPVNCTQTRQVSSQTIKYGNPLDRLLAPPVRKHPTQVSAKNSVGQLKGAAKLLAAYVEWIPGWFHRPALNREAKRRAIGALDDRTLRDIGLLRSHVMISECSDGEK